MKSHVLLILLLFASALLQQTLPAWPVFGGLKPPVMLAVVLHAALRLPVREVLGLTMLAAVVHDGLEPGPFGPALIAYPLLAVLAVRFRNDLFCNSMAMQTFFGALAGLVAVLAAILVYAATGARPLTGSGRRLGGGPFLGAATLLIVSLLLPKIPEKDRGGRTRP